MVAITNTDLLLFPFFANLTFWCENKGILNPVDPISAPVSASKDNSLIISGNWSECEASCPLDKWPNFMHFILDYNGDLCLERSHSYCDCKRLHCIGSTVSLDGIPGRFGNLKIPYNTPELASWKWLEFCRNQFADRAGPAIVCRQLGFSPHEAYSSEDLQEKGLRSPVEFQDYPDKTLESDILFLPRTTSCPDSNAAKLSQCRFTESLAPAPPNCRPAHVYCSNGEQSRIPPISLTGSTSVSERELQIFMRAMGEWSTVCRKDWTPQDNSLACELVGQTDPFNNAQARSCWEHRVNNLFYDRKPYNGIYLIFVVPPNKPGQFYPVYCEMETAHGGWTLVFSAKLPGVSTGWTNQDTILERNVYDPNPTNDYSILFMADNIDVPENSADATKELMIQTKDANGIINHLIVKYPKAYSLIQTIQKTANVAVVSKSDDMQFNVAEGFDDHLLGMPWLFTIGTSVFYTMNSKMTATSSIGLRLSGTIVATDPNHSDRIFIAGTPKTATIIAMYVRAQNHWIKDPPVVENCKAMDYLLDGNRRIDNGQLSASSSYIDGSSGPTQATKFQAHNSFLSDDSGWVGKDGVLAESSWIAVDLIERHKIAAVLTRGVEPQFPLAASQTNIKKWITHFTLEEASEENSDSQIRYLMNGRTFPVPPEDISASRITTSSIMAGTDRPVRLLRLRPQFQTTDTVPGNEAFGLRWEVIGCSTVPRSQNRYILKHIQLDALGLKPELGLDYRMGTDLDKVWSSANCDFSFLIRFPELYLIKTIVIAGHPNFRNNAVSKFWLMYSKSGSAADLKWYGTETDSAYPPDDDERREFNGPVDSIPRYITFTYPWSARLVRIVVKGDEGNLPVKCYLRLEIVGRPFRDSCTIPLGMSISSRAIADFQLKSSSQFTLDCTTNDMTTCKMSYGPERARYGGFTDQRGYGAWRPADNDTSPSITVDFRGNVQLTAVIIESFELSYVSAFDISYSYENEAWARYPRTLSTSMNRIGTSFVIYLAPPVYARLVRIENIQYQSFGLFPQRLAKFEFLGCKIPAAYHPKLPEFRIFNKVKLFPKQHMDSYFLQTPLQTPQTPQTLDLDEMQCAERCLHEHGFVCLGYYFENLTCTLTAGNQLSWDVTGLKGQQTGNFNERDMPCAADLGIINPNVVADNQFSASTNVKLASSSRLLTPADGLYSKGWAPTDNDRNPWLMVDLLTVHRVTGLHINGDGGKYVRTFYLSTCRGLPEKETWRFCCNQNGITKTVLFANHDPTNAVTVWLPLLLVGRYFRIHPIFKETEKRTALQFELIGCPEPSREPETPMALGSLKCKGTEETFEECTQTLSDPTDKHCSFNTTVRPNCVAFCGDPGIRGCSTRTGLNFFAPHSLTFWCMDGTHNTITCQETGFWSSLGSSCVKGASGTNVALQKLAYQSSTSRIPNVQDATNAVDGVKDFLDGTVADETSVSNKIYTCSYTDVEPNPWWYVDLGRDYEITQIEITFGFAYQNIELRIGLKNPQTSNGLVNLKLNDVCQGCSFNRGNNDDESREYTFIVPETFGQFVSIQIPSRLPAALSICEIKILATPCTQGDFEDQGAYSSVSQSSSSDAVVISPTSSPAGSPSRPVRTVDESAAENEVASNLVCRKTKSEINPYRIMVPTGEVGVKEVELETDSNVVYQLHDYEVRIGDYARPQDFEKNTRCGPKKQGIVAPGSKEIVKCSDDDLHLLYGSFVIIRILSPMQSTLSLCKVKITARRCLSVLDSTYMRPILASSSAEDNDMWALLYDAESCFQTGLELSPWVALDTTQYQTIPTVSFNLCDQMTSGILELRVGDNQNDWSQNRILTTVRITSEQSATVYNVDATEFPPPAGRYFFMRLLPTGAAQSLCVCAINFVRTRYCPRFDQQYHNVAYGVAKIETTASENPLRPSSLTVDGVREVLTHLCFSTVHTRPYWKITLPSPRKIYLVRVIGRQDSRREITIGNQNSGSYERCGDVILNYTKGIKSKTVSCVKSNGDPLYGNTIKLQVIDQGSTLKSLLICEVEVWGV